LAKFVLMTSVNQQVFVARALPVDVRSYFGPGVKVDVFGAPRPPTRAELLAEAKGAGGLVTLLSDVVDGALLDALPDVRVVANFAVGYDNVDVDACTARGVWVTNTPDVLTEATADLTFALILALARRIREGERLVREGRFDGWSPTMLLGMELGEKTLGIFGPGRIGSAVARRGEAFGMEILVTGRESGVPFDELLASSDVLSIHVPLTEDTRHAFDEAALSKMKPGSLLINTARGPIVDEKALVNALDAGRIAGAGLDVYEEEPKVHPGLLKRDDVVLLPHLGSATRETRRAMARLALTNCAAVLRGERPPNPVNELG
jgi:glyoxylate reductase